MRPFSSLLPFDEALRILRAAAMPIARTESLRLLECAGRVSAEDVRAAHDVPPFDRAAMDGYAVRAADTTGASAATPVALRVRGAVYAGDLTGSVVLPRECVEIATGAPLPNGTNAVVRVEDTAPSPTPDDVLVLSALVAGQHVGPRGSDMAHGTAVVAAGDLLTPARIGAAAAAGRSSLTVFARPRVAIVSSGNELAEPGAPLAPGHVHDVNAVTLAALVRAHGGLDVIRPTVRDDALALQRGLDGAADTDIVVISGGSSVGTRDLLADAVRRAGEVLFHGIAVKPGKPTLLARIGTTLLLGMPGNPTSCLSNGYLLLVPLLRATARLPPWRPETRTLPLARDIRTTTGRHQFHSVRVEAAAAVPVFKGSGDITSLSRADGYIEIAADVSFIAEGTPVRVTIF